MRNRVNAPTFVISGTDTGVGKTVFAAALTGALGATYWKPIQAGLEDETDSETVARLGAVPPGRILPEAYRLRTPASPHRAAELDGVEIDKDCMTPPTTGGALVIEGAGGLMVPLARNVLTIDLFAYWGLPVILCARTRLGAINHALLSIEALTRRSIPLHGVAFVGEAAEDTQATIATFSGARVLGRLPHLDPLNPDALAGAFSTAFQIEDFMR